MFEQGDFFEHQTVAGSIECRNGHEPDGCASRDGNSSNGDQTPGATASTTTGGDGEGAALVVVAAPSTLPRGWHLTRHVCRVCFGRVLTRSVGFRREFICSNCEITVTARSHRAICQCGAKFSDVRRGPGKRIGGSMGLRCIKNPNRGPSSPSVIVAGERA